MLVFLLAVFFGGFVHADQSYRVINVAANSVLNIRTDIHRVEKFTDGQVVGAIPSDADPVEATGFRSFSMAPDGVRCGLPVSRGG